MIRRSSFTGKMKKPLFFLFDLHIETLPFNELAFIKKHPKVQWHSCRVFLSTKTSNPKYFLASSFLVVEGDVTYGFAKWHRCIAQQKRDGSSLYQSFHQKSLCMLKKQKRCSLNCKTYLISNMNKFAMEESNKSAVFHQKISHRK